VWVVVFREKVPCKFFLQMPANAGARQLRLEQEIQMTSSKGNAAWLPGKKFPLLQIIFFRFDGGAAPKILERSRDGSV
jgi:hypothetical protein